MTCAQVVKWSAFVTTLIIGVIAVCVDIVAVLYHYCTINFTNLGAGAFTVFLRHHIIGNASDCYGPQQWFLCNSTNHVYEEVNEAPHSYTDPESVFIFLVAHGLIHFIWATGSIIGITIGITAKGRDSSCSDWLWIVITAMALLFGITTAGLFTVDIVDAAGLKNCPAFPDKSFTDYLLAQLILPIYFSYGVLIWLVLAIFWAILVVDQLRTRGGQHNLNKQIKGRSLSEVQPEEFSSKLNKRFQEGEMIEENESRSSHDLMATPTMGMGMVTRAAIQQQQRPIPDAYQGHQSRQATGDWVYANPAFLKDEAYSRPKSSSPAIQEQKELYAMPKSFGSESRPPPHRLRTISNSSEMSDNRKLGRPVSMPTLPQVDYPLPRASVSGSRPDVSRKTPRKAIRTPSGRNISATEYLRGGYLPQQKSLPEEEHEEAGVERYFVKLKQ